MSGSVRTRRPLGRYKPYPEYKDSGVEWLGEIPATWDLKRLKNITEFRGGGTPPKETLEYWRGEIPWVSPKDMKVSVILETEDKITAQAVRQSATKFVPAGSVLIVVRSGILGHSIPVALAGREVTLNQDLKALIPKSMIAAEYLMYLVSGMQRELLVEWRKEGATVESLEVDLVAQTPTPLPSIPEQHSIAAFLDRETARIDALVAKKERLIELLQEKRTALITRAVTKGLDPNVPMKNSGVEWLGEIPAHWRVLPFTKYLVEKSDYRGKTPEKTTDGVLLVTARNVRMGFIDYECSQEFVAEGDYREIMRRGLPRKGDILFTTEAPLGNVALVDREDVALAQRIIRFRVKSDVLDSQFALLGMMSLPFQAQLDSLSTGSTAEGLKASKLPQLRLAAPPVGEQYIIIEHVHRVMTNADALLAKVRDAIDRLRELRTALISAAVTGKIDVRKEVA